MIKREEVAAQGILPQQGFSAGHLLPFSCWDRSHSSTKVFVKISVRQIDASTKVSHVDIFLFRHQVDDKSELEHLHERLEQEVEKPYYKGKVKIVRNKEREGLLRYVSRFSSFRLLRVLGRRGCCSGWQ